MGKLLVHLFTHAPYIFSFRSPHLSYISTHTHTHSLSRLSHSCHSNSSRHPASLLKGSSSSAALNGRGSVGMVSAAFDRRALHHHHTNNNSSSSSELTHSSSAAAAATTNRCFTAGDQSHVKGNGYIAKPTNGNRATAASGTNSVRPAKEDLATR